MCFVYCFDIFFVKFYYYFFHVFILFFNCVRFVAWSLPLGPWSMDSEAWSLQLLAIDHDPWTKLGPSIAHDLEFSRDGQQLAW